MSLINEALKKAERERALEQAEGSIPSQGGRMRIAKRGAPMRTQTLLMIAAGAVVLVVVSAVLTGVFVTRKIDPKPIEAKPAPAARVAVAPAATPPVITVARIPSLPAPPPPATDGNSQLKSPAKSQSAPGELYAPSSFRAETAGPATALTASATAIGPSLPAADPASRNRTASIETSSSLMTNPASAAPAATPTDAPPTPAPPRHDARIQALVDGFHVTGIRSAGGSSKVLMNERVFRVNDIVDYGYGLKLTAVTPETLTFADANGEIYLKNF